MHPWWWGKFPVLGTDRDELGRICLSVAGEWLCPPIREQNWKPEKGLPLGSGTEAQHYSSKRSGCSAKAANPATAGERLYMGCPSPFLRRKDFQNPPVEEARSGRFLALSWNPSRESYQSRELVRASCCYKYHLSNLGLTFVGQWHFLSQKPTVLKKKEPLFLFPPFHHPLPVEHQARNDKQSLDLPRKQGRAT